MTFDEKRITVVLETNTRVPSPSVSVWVAPGLYDDSDHNCLAYDELDESIRLIGPVDPEAGRSLYQNLIALFAKAGFEVAQLETADD